MIAFFARWLGLFFLLLVIACVAGCASYNNRCDTFMKPYEAGQFDVAAQNIDAAVGSAGTAASSAVDKRDEIVNRLQQGKICRAAGRLDDSVRAFRHASDVIDVADQKADLRVSEEAATALTNQTYRDYRATNYDRLALQLYLALDDMELGRVDDARIALRGMQQCVADAEEHYQKEIARLQDKADAQKVATPPASPDPPGTQPASGQSEQAKAATWKGRADVNRSLNDPKFRNGFKAAYNMDAPVVVDRTAYKTFTNPFGEYLLGVYFMAAGNSNSDDDTARTAFRHVLGMLPNNPYVAADVAAVEKVISGGKLPPTTYVFFETGLAPKREQIRIDLPIFIVNMAVRDTGVDYVGAAFPRLKLRDGHAPYLSVNVNGVTLKTEVMTDMDEVIKQDFNNELPIVITRTLIATAVKAGAAYGIHEATKQNSYVDFAARFGTTVYQAVMNQADLRTWTTLPKQFQAARFDTPADRTLILAVPGCPPIDPLKLQDGMINVVYVKSVQAGQMPTVRQFILKK